MGTTECLRCYRFMQRTPHVLEVHTESLDKCYTSEEAAIRTCPTAQQIRDKRTLSLMLFSKFKYGIMSIINVDIRYNLSIYSRIARFHITTLTIFPHSLVNRNFQSDVKLATTSGVLPYQWSVQFHVRPERWHRDHERVHGPHLKGL